MPTKTTGKGLQRVTSRVWYITDPDKPRPREHAVKGAEPCCAALEKRKRKLGVHITIYSSNDSNGFTSFKIIKAAVLNTVTLSPCSASLSLSLSLSLSHTHRHYLSLSLSLSHSFSLSHTHRHYLSLSLSHTQTLSLSLSLSHTLSLSLSLSLSHTQTLSLSLSLSLSLIQIIRSAPTNCSNYRLIFTQQWEAL